MSLTITVSDPLAGQLITWAEVENVPVDQVASRLMERGMKPPLPPEQWDIFNKRRVALINKVDNGLTNEEQLELQQLQALADRQAEEFDWSRLDHVVRMEAAARSILGRAE